MKIRVVFCALCLLASAAIAAPEYRADRILVKPKRNIPGVRIAAVHAALRAHIHRQYPQFGGWQVIKLPRGLSVEKALERYRRSGLFEKVQPDYIRHVVTSPNDPYFPGSLYGLLKIAATNAWDIRTDATNVIVAVIDTGARLDHEDLASNLWVNTGEIPGNGIDDDNDGYIDDVHGINAITGSGDPSDDHGHGTHTSGTVGGVGNNGVGVCGVAWHVQLMPLKFITSGGSGADSDAIECIQFAMAHGAHIMSNSWGGFGDSPALYDAIRAARNAGIIFVAAAGNSSTDVDALPFVPAGFDLDNIVSVAATDSGDNLAGFSNYGRQGVDLGAPGVGIVSTWLGATNSYNTLSGTSMATPLVAGALALVKAQFPSESYTQLIHRVLGNVDPLPALSNLTVTGGRLNLYKALTQTPAPLADFTASQQGAFTVVFTNLTMGAVTNLTWNFGDGSPASTVSNPTHTYTNAGTFNVALSVAGIGGTHARTRSVAVGPNYYMQPISFNWINPTGMTSVALTDDSVSGAQTIPFSFVYYGQTNTTLYVGSNGLLGFNSDNLSWPLHVKLPFSGTPNNALYPCWGDLNPGVGGAVYVGSTGSAPNRVEVISWVGVPHFETSSVTYTFQVLLYETSNEIVFQYQEIQPTNASYGAGNAVTIGIENSAGTIARQYGFNGSQPVTNNQAILFTLTPPAPVLNPPASPATNLLITITGNTVPLASVALFTNTCAVQLATGTAGEAGTFAFSVPVQTNSTTTFTALAVDIAGNTSACSSAVSYIHLDPATDADGDGFTNLDELNAGTPPLDPASYPYATLFLDGTVQISSVSGKTYRLQRCDELPGGDWTNVGAPQTGDGSPLTFPDVAGVPQRFYRVKISP